jgi:hypothetical protein
MQTQKEQRIINRAKMMKRTNKAIEENVIL